MKKHTIIGMAGHIDHGKTALIKALTGIETDRAPEEKKRGITIDIGFAYWKDNVTIIDVPGHEKFVHNMVAGVSTVDFFLLVIAADDGIMPQTIEHLDILKFFGVKQGIVAITKSDLVEPDWLELIHSETEDFLEQKGFSQIPIFNVSAVTGQGIDELRTEISDRIQNREQHIYDRPFRLNVDRSFTVKGYGQVVTGTVLSSSVKTGDSLTLLPVEKPVKVRGIQIHQKESDLASGGQRAALNIGGIEKDKLVRGAVLVDGQTLKPVREIFARVSTTDYFNFRMKRHSMVRVHLGTSELSGRLDWFEQDKNIQKKTDYHIRIKFDTNAVCAPGDAILIRSLSPATTLAGGRVLQIDPPKIRRSDARWEKYMHILSSGTLKEKLEQFFDYGGFREYSLSNLQHQFFENKQILLQNMQALLKARRVERYEKNDKISFLSVAMINRLIQVIKEKTEADLNNNPARKGFNQLEITAKLKTYRVSSLFLEIALKRALNRGTLIRIDDVYTTKEHASDENTEKILAEIEALYAEARFNPPGVEQVAQQLNLSKEEIKSLTGRLVKNGKLNSIDGIFYLQSKVFQGLLSWLENYFQKNSELTVSTVRDFTGSSRKYIIPLLEFLDHQGVTERRGEIRVQGNSQTF